MADGAPTTIIQGSAKAPLCNEQRILLEFYVYDSPPPSGGLFGLPPPNNQLPAKYAQRVLQEIQQNWDCTAEINDDSGLRAQCWEPKNRHKPHVSICEPTLIFRGSRQVFTDLAVYVRIDWGILHGDFCVVPDLTGVSPGRMAIARRDSPPGASIHVVPGSESKNTQSGLGVFGYQTMAGTVRGRVQAAGWERFTILDETRTVQAPSYDPEDPFDLTLRLQVEVWAGPNGDWANNFRQGWGIASPLYNNAKNWAVGQVQRLKDAYDPPRIFFTGHSLGGGVASACAQWCAFRLGRDPRLTLRGLTFNSAGLHPNTVTPGSLRAANVFDYTVRDEILTTLQSRTNDMPLIGHFFRIAKRKLPEAVTNITISPGTSGGDAPLPAEGQPLPVLFPAKQQTAIKVDHDWSYLTALDGVLASSNTTLEFFQNFLEMLNMRYGAEARDDSWTVVGMYQKMIGQFMTGLQPEVGDVSKLFAFSTAYHLMPQVAETYFGKV